MLIYDLIEYSVNYSKISGSLWQYYRDKPNENLTDSESFESKIKKQEILQLMVIQKMSK